MSDYYKRSPETEYKIYKDRERSWNVLRFGVLFSLLLGVIALFSRWSRNIVEPTVNHLSTPTGKQAVVSFDVSCLYFPFLIVTGKQ